ncbi:FtsK/SpoIIIE domain-containing protein [Actinomadura adrarensis]|uniref:FtsK/SpoIIIE domain-containing protein n=1 Tax=Actinomadura adrarensis TaxID=1819600 RepID=A0ABW3CBD0_9ACTN
MYRLREDLSRVRRDENGEGPPLYCGMELSGRYLLEECIGRGGMGEVWRALDRRLDRSVAVKILPASQRDVAGRVDRFRREARIAAGLQHPGITVVHDVGEHEGLLYFVMEHLKGEDLSKIIRRAPSGLPIDRVLRLGIQLADALDTAHRHGVVHRDIKPSNIMVTTFDRVKVCDFGVARIVETLSGETGTVGVGTPLYTAPEQFEGRASACADLYSLGCVLYEVVTGLTPFQGPPPTLMYKHKYEAPRPIDSLRDDVPAELGALMMELLEKDMEKRPKDASVVGERLRALRRTLRDVGARPAVALPDSERSEKGAPPDLRTVMPPPASLLGADSEDVSPGSRAVRLGAVLRAALDEPEIHPLTLGLGEGPDGAVVVDLARLAHVLIAGAEPEAKTMVMHSVVTSLLMHAKPDQVRMVLADSTHAELSAYGSIPHLLTPAVTDAGSAIGMLAWAEEEMDRRYDTLAAHGYRHIDAYNQAVRSGQVQDDQLVYPYIVVVVAEFSELVAIAPRETENLIGRLTRLARAVGIHLVLCTHQVTERVLSRRLRADVPSRLALRLNSVEGSELVIDQAGAEKLLAGEVLFLAKGADSPIRMCGTAVGPSEIAAVVEHWFRSA